jgi:hypothetical protein
MKDVIIALCILIDTIVFGVLVAIAISEDAKKGTMTLLIGLFLLSLISTILFIGG